MDSSRRIHRPAKQAVLWAARGAVLAALATTIPAGGARAQLSLNEVLYDPEGPDEGREWIEVHNAGPWPAPTEGLSLEFANGSDPGRWTVIWAGFPERWIDPGGFFLVGARTDGPVDAPAVLGLQNGPDAVRLVREGYVLDRVGWGEALPPGLAEGRPAQAVAAGSSLARRDGLDSDDNRTDFSEAVPSPGRANFPETDLAVRVLPTGGRALPVGANDRSVPVEVQLENRGQRPVAAAEIEWTAAGNRIPVPFGRLDPGEIARERIEAPVDPMAGGFGRVRVRVQVPGDPVPENDADSLDVARGSAPVRLVEIHPRPGSDGSEYVELELVHEVDLSGWRLEDASGGGATVDSVGVRAPGLEVLSPPAGPGSLPVGGWPSLNDRAGPDGVADSLFLLDPSGVIRDWAVYAEGEAGLSWVRLPGPERADPRDLWVLDPDHPGGTPGRPGPDSGPGAPESLEGNWLVVEPGSEGAWLSLPADSRSYRLRVYDSTGRPVDRAAGSVGEGRVRWDVRGENGSPLVPGVYLLEIEVSTARGPLRERRVLVLDR